MILCRKSIVLGFLAIFNCFASPLFPLKLSSNYRYLVDQREFPFLIKEISAWGLIQALSEDDAIAFMDSIVLKGFNTMLISLISADKRFTGNPPNWMDICPFKIKWDFSTYDTAYFSHADRIINAANVRGLLILLVPCYLGYKYDSLQGWWDEIQNLNNSPEKCRRYGDFIGNRYKNSDNIIWVAGGDNDATEELHAYMSSILSGIKANAHQLWTGHFSTYNWSMDNPIYASELDINGLYAWTESNFQTLQYLSELEKYSEGKMIFQLDQSYEHDIPHYSDNENYQWIRRKNYDGILSGCAGTSFCPGIANKSCSEINCGGDSVLYTFKIWKRLMNTRGMREAEYCFEFFSDLKWYDLIPDQQSLFFIRGRGKFGDIEYSCAAFSADSSLAIAYVPSPRDLTVKMSAFNGSEVSVQWFDPTNGNYYKVDGSPFPNTGNRTFSSPLKNNAGEGDFILLLEAGNPVKIAGISQRLVVEHPDRISPSSNTNFTNTSYTSNKQPAESKILVYSLSGSIVRSLNQSVLSSRDVKDMAPGIYLIVFQSNNLLTMQEILLLP